MTTTERGTEPGLVKKSYQLVDPFINMLKPPSAADASSTHYFKESKHHLEGGTFEDTIAEMDKAGIEKGLLINPFYVSRNGKSVTDYSGNPWKVGMGITDEMFYEACEALADWCARSNGRLSGHMLLDPTDGMNAVRRLARSVKEFGFVSAHIIPGTTGLPPDHACYFPIYAKCIELGIPIKINMGLPGGSSIQAWTQQTMCLDEVSVAFPELIVVMTHVSHPWHLETVAMLQKHANFRLITSAFAPKHVPEEIWRAANTRAGHKVMWSSDFPVLPMDRCAREGWEVPLKDEVKRRYLRENALETFKLGCPPGSSVPRTDGNVTRSIGKPQRALPAGAGQRHPRQPRRLHPSRMP